MSSRGMGPFIQVEFVQTQLASQPCIHSPTLPSAQRPCWQVCEFRLCKVLVNNLLKISVSPAVRLHGNFDGSRAILPSCQCPKCIT